MEPRHRGGRVAHQASHPAPPLARLFAAGLGLALAACGAPGDPVAPRPIVPEVVTDLAARQSGESVVLTFTLPDRSTEGERLAAIPQVEVYRTLLPGNALPEAGHLPVSPRYTVPAAVVDTYLQDGRVVFTDPWTPEDLAAHAGEQAVYRVRTRASRRRASEGSNLAWLRVYPVPQPVSDLRAQVTQDGVELEWSPPGRTTSGGVLPSLGGYRVYRADVPGQAEGDAAGRLALLAVTPSPSYRDTQFAFGRTYVYTVRSVAQYAADPVESSDSNALRVTPRDTFPPAAPTGLVLVSVPATPEAPAEIQLSWAMNAEADLAGYHVYRSEGDDTRGARANGDLLLVPTFRDTHLAAGRRYTYRITAVDRTGNESPPSAPAQGELSRPEESSGPAR